MIRTKIVCTIGPASRTPEMLRKLIDAGMDVARLNFSHADRQEHLENITRIRATSQAAGKSVAIMADLQGPKIRIGLVADGGVQINEGECVVLTTRDITGQREASGGVQATIPVHYTNLPKDIKAGETVLIDDGLIEMKVREISGQDIVCKVLIGGLLTDHKGLNLPDTQISVPSLTEKDLADLDFCLQQGLDWVALSFVRSADDVLRVKQHIATHCQPDSPIRVIAKIEKPQALNDIDAIINAADAIMIARGDLGIEIPAEDVPLAQKQLIRLCNTAAKPVITATQMLDSMIRNPRPTRAEASDVANAILDGTDAIMLSGETAAGKYPLEAIETMVRIAGEIEKATLSEPWRPPKHVRITMDDVTDAVSHATCETSHALQATAIITATASGTTARNVAKYRPHVPILAPTFNPTVERQLRLSWGVIPFHTSRANTTDDLIRDSLKLAASMGVAKPMDRVVITAGVTVHTPGMTNLMLVEVMI
ncbi:MAG: pyruvate kinase [Anaerolineae bacterium]|nr:pyruvate kinase [Anaerolineae bacterium]